MKKFYSYIVGAMVLALPLSIAAVAALPAINDTVEETTANGVATINFADSTYATSSAESNEGDITEDRVFQIGEGTMTVTPSTSGTANRFWAVKGKPQLRLYGGKMVFEAPEGRAITKIEFTTGKTWTEPTYEPANNATAKKQWEGNAVKVTATIGKQCQINTITVTYANANEETIKPEVKVVTFETAENIATFNALPKDSAVRLTLTDAYVTKVYNGNIYVQDATAATIFHNTGLNLEEGQVLNGTIIGKQAPYNDIPELAANDSTNLDKVVITEGAATPKEVTLATVNNDILSQLVKLGEAKLIDSLGNHYAVQGEDTMQVYDQFRVLGEEYVWPEEALSITAIVGSYKGNVQLMPVSAEAIEAKPEPALESGVYYLYNVATKKWLAAGNSWGTQASLNDYGLDFTVSMLEDGTYTLDSRVANNATQHFLGANAYVDANAYGWNITDITAEGDTEKVLQLTTADGKFLAFSGEGTVVNATNVADADAAKWIAVSREKRIQDIMDALPTASKENPVDVTLLFQGMNFGRNDQRNSAWQGSPTLSGDNDNFCAEKYNTVFDVNQTAEVPNGVYSVVYQGFYRDGKAAEAAAARTDSTENINAVVYAGEVEKPMLSIFAAAGQKDNVGTNTTFGYVPQTMSDASKYFSAGLYNDTIKNVVVNQGSLKIGVKQTVEGRGSNWTIFDNFRVFCTSNKIDLTIYKEAYEAALAAAQVAQADTIVTGEEMAALNAAVEQYGTIAEETQEAYEEATSALKAATANLKNARNAYLALANAKKAVKNYPYAAVQKVDDLKAAIDLAPANATQADSIAAVLPQLERVASESNSLAEADETALNMTDLIVNPLAADAIDANVWKISGGKINIKSSEPWTDAEGNAEHRYFDSDNWSDKSWTTNMTQELKLTEGQYILSVMARANAEMETFKLYANFGEDQLGSVDMMHHGSSNGLFNFGWERNYVVIDVPMDGAVTIGVEGSTNTAHSWMSFADFRLVKIGVMDYDRDTTITVAPTDNVWMAYVGQEKEVSLTIAHTGTTGTIAPFSVAVGYENADDAEQQGSLNPASVSTTPLHAGESAVASATWTPAATGSFYLYYVNAEGEKVRSEKAITVYASKEEMEAVIAGVSNILIDANAAANVYTVDGQLVRKNAKSLTGLPKGLYIVAGKKVVVK